MRDAQTPDHQSLSTLINHLRDGGWLSQISSGNSSGGRGIFATSCVPFFWITILAASYFGKGSRRTLRLYRVSPFMATRDLAGQNTLFWTVSNALQLSNMHSLRPTFPCLTG